MSSLTPVIWQEGRYINHHINSLNAAQVTVFRRRSDYIGGEQGDISCMVFRHKRGLRDL